MHANDSGDGPGATYLLLGPPAIRTTSGLRSVRGRLQTTLFSVLALHAGFPVASDRLVDALWQDSPPSDAVNALQSQVSRLRLSLGSSAVRFGSGTYELAVEPGSVDVHLFERLLGESRQLHDGGAYVLARRTVESALALWRGTPFPELADSDFARLEAMRLDELRLQALVIRLEADLALRREGSAIFTLRQLTAAYPLREDLWSLLVLALYRSGRPADALAAYRAARTTLIREIGLEPGPRLRELEAAVLCHDPGLLAPLHPCAAHGQQLAATPRPLVRLVAPATPGGEPTRPVQHGDPAVEVFVERARCNLPGFTPDHRESAQIAALCRVLEDEPLSIELAATQLPEVSPRRLLSIHRRTPDDLVTPG